MDFSKTPWPSLNEEGFFRSDYAVLIADLHKGKKQTEKTMKLR